MAKEADNGAASNDTCMLRTFLTMINLFIKKKADLIDAVSMH